MLLVQREKEESWMCESGNSEGQDAGVQGRGGCKGRTRVDGWEETAEEQQLMDPGFRAGGHTSSMSRLSFQPIGALLSQSHKMWQGTVAEGSVQMASKQAAPILSWVFYLFLRSLPRWLVCFGGGGGAPVDFDGRSHPPNDPSNHLCTGLTNA